MLKERIMKFYFYRHTLFEMVIKQLKAKYAGSRLGIWWAVVTPLVLAISINFVFNIVFKAAIPNYTLFILAGILPWFFFTNALLEATNSFINNSPILRQCIFPREFIPISSILANLLNFFIGLIFLFPLFIILNFKVINFLPFLCIAIIIHLIFVIGLGLLFSSVNTFFRDFYHFLSIGCMLWFWITPVFYSLDMLPFSFRWVYFLNPMSYFIVLYQRVLFYARAPILSDVLMAFLISLLFFIIGYIIFLKVESQLVKRI